MNHHAAVKSQRADHVVAPPPPPNAPQTVIEAHVSKLDEISKDLKILAERLRDIRDRAHGAEPGDACGHSVPQPVGFSAVMRDRTDCIGELLAQCRHLAGEIETFV